MTTSRRPPRVFRVLLVFDRGPRFESTEQAHDIPRALDQAERYARALGWTGTVKKKFVNEVEQQGCAA